MAVTLSVIQNWTADHLRDFATHFTDLSNRRTDTMGAINSSAIGQTWEGLGRDGKRATLATESAITDGEAAQMQAAAMVATDGANALYGQQQQILAAVKFAEGQGFKVDEDWSVTDTMFSPGSLGYLARQSIARGIASDLQTQATAFNGQEVATASGIASSASGLGGV